MAYHSGEPATPRPVSSRRAFLRRSGGLVAATTLPAFAFTRARLDLDELAGAARQLDGRQSQEPFWKLVRAQFPLRPDLTMLNAANLCPAPFVVSDAVASLTRDIDADPSFQNRAKFSQLQEASIEALAAHMGAASDQIVITRNTSESNNAAINALTLGPGDEVVIWDQNHPTNNVAWDVRAQRYGFTVRRVSVPAQTRTADALAAPFLSALGPSTRVLAFSHVSNVSGVRLPAAALCAEARRRGILTLVDGAQSLGALVIDVRAMGCDFYTASMHKWFMGPKEAGVLYVREGLASSLWPSTVGVGWDQAKDRGTRRFGTLGQRDDATLAAVGRTVEFHRAIGAARIEQRVVELATRLKDRLRTAVPVLVLHTPDDPALSAGVVIFGAPRIDPRPTYEELYARHGIASATAGGGFSGLRFCPHIYTTTAELDAAVDAVVTATG
ncbi:MAG: aminotransferase class V-fold PLP-dependent enzyme [Gemmatimonadetes bacterium]|nr:aminotransferase class V-fold PLP-dependent enzyme [Gemmatimonadota bacterium]